jgi:hypothetical protein
MTKRAASPPPASLLLALAALLGCASEAPVGAGGSTTTYPTTGEGTGGWTTTTWPGSGGSTTTWPGSGGSTTTWPGSGGAATGTTTVASCNSPLLDCTYSATGCDCKGSCPASTIEVVCTDGDGAEDGGVDSGTQQCACYLDGSSVGTCTGAFPYGPYDSYYGCGGQTGLGCCDGLLPGG